MQITDNLLDLYNTIEKQFPEDKDLWLDHINFNFSSKDKLMIQVPNCLYKDRFYEKYNIIVKKWLSVNYISQNISIDVISIDNEQEISIQDIKKSNKKQNNNITKDSVSNFRNSHNTFSSELNPNYTFKRLIQGEHNRLAYAAGIRIAEYPAYEYNPFFIYGGVGRGKTHLMHAIGHIIKKNENLMKIIYATSEQFTNEYIYSLQKNRTHAFRLKYRSADLLLIDDIQFLEGKEKIQEELFHTFNMLKESGKQMVFTSDRSPKQLKTITDRLVSRFSSGLLTDIKMPDTSTRKEILIRKIEENKLNLSNELIDFLADNITKNIRDLEACVLKIKSFISLLGEKVTMKTVKNQLKDFLLSSETIKEPLSIDAIQKEVARYYHINYADLKSKKRTSIISKARQIAVYLAKKLTSLSTTQLGYEFGGRNHSTVISSYKKIKSLINTNNNIEYDVKFLEKRLLEI